MAQEEFRLLGAALMLGRFSKADLVRAASVKTNTAASWLRRNERLLERLPGSSAPEHPAAGTRSAQIAMAPAGGRCPGSAGTPWTDCELRRPDWSPSRSAYAGP